MRYDAEGSMPFGSGFRALNGLGATVSTRSGKLLPELCPELFPSSALTPGVSVCDYGRRWPGPLKGTASAKIQRCQIEKGRSSGYRFFTR